MHVHAKKSDIPKELLSVVDRFTIEHRNFTDGKIQHLGMQMVCNRVEDYSKRIEEAQGGDPKVLLNRKAKLAYWQSRQAFTFVIAKRSY